MCTHWYCKNCDKLFYSKRCKTLKCYYYQNVIDTLCEICPLKIKNKINIPVCEEHKICFCDECINIYQEKGFSSFNNRCDHENTQCQTAHTSQKYISQEQLISLYNNYSDKLIRLKI